MLVPMLAGAALGQSLEVPMPGQEAPPPPVAAVVVTETPAQTVPFRMSFVPGVGIGAAPDAAVDGASVGMLSQASSLRGIDTELVLSYVTGPVEGIQAAIAGNVARDLNGLQLSVGMNHARNVTVGQFTSGVNVAEGSVRGVQASTGLNVAGGALNGVQATAGLNVALGEGSQGVQVSAGLNVAKDLSGVQAAPVNVADAVDGLQLGLVNIGRRVDGVQFGLVNIAETSDVSIAPINLVKDGLHRIDIWTSESAVGSVALKFGSKQVYTLLGAGWLNPRQSWWTYGGGFGVHLQRELLWLEVDDSVWGIASGNVVAHGLHNKLRAQVGLDVVPHFSPFVGVSVNTWIGDGTVWPRLITDDLPSQTSKGRKIVTWPGVHAGVSF